MKLPEKIRDWPAEWRELYEERAGIMEHEGHLSKFTAEIRAEQDTRRTFEQSTTRTNAQFTEST